MAHRFNPANMDRLLNEERKVWNAPDQIIRHLALAPQMVMADIGCGPGWFTLPAAHQLQEGGLIYAVDVSEEMLARLKERAETAGLQNVKPVLAEEPDEYPVPTESIDVVLIANVYHEIDPASMFLVEIRRLLKPGGHCLVVDWKPEQTPMGPPVTERLAPTDVIEEFQAAGFTLANTCDVGPYHYGLKFRKSTEDGQP